MVVDNEHWRALAAQQAGLLSRTQLRVLGFDRWAVRNKVASERWSAVSSSVICTTTGALGREQLMWAGVLATEGPALVGDLTAAEVHGLRNWHRDDVTVLVPRGADIEPICGIRFVETRRDLSLMKTRVGGLPLMRMEPAVLHFAACQHSVRTAEGVIAAAVQQRLVAPADLLRWVDRMKPLRRAPRLRRAIGEIDSGAQSVAEIDVRRLCRRFGLVLPQRQVKRRDASGRTRFTDCEWRLADGRVLVLEVDGAFHMEVEHWEEDLARQRALSASDRVVVRCTARELRDEPERLAHDLRVLGVPRVA